MAAIAANLIKQPFPHQDRSFDGWVIWDHAPRDRQGGLEQRYRGYIGYRQFIREAVAIRIAVRSKPLFRLHAMVMIHGVICELADRNNSPRLVIRKNHETWGRCPAGFQTGSGQTHNFRSIPSATDIMGDESE